MWSDEMGNKEDEMIQEQTGSDFVATSFAERMFLKDTGEKCGTGTQCANQLVHQLCLCDGFLDPLNRSVILQFHQTEIVSHIH